MTESCNPLQDKTRLSIPLHAFLLAHLTHLTNKLNPCFSVKCTRYLKGNDARKREYKLHHRIVQLIRNHQWLERPDNLQSQPASWAPRLELCHLAQKPQAIAGTRSPKGRVAGDARAAERADVQEVLPGLRRSLEDSEKRSKPKHSTPPFFRPRPPMSLPMNSFSCMSLPHGLPHT